MSGTYGAREIVRNPSLLRKLLKMSVREDMRF